MALNQPKKQQHVVAIPYPAQGHITPMLQLCRQLAPYGFTFTFVNTHHIHLRVQHAHRSSPARGVHGSDQYDAVAHPDEEYHNTQETHTDGAPAHDDSNQNEQGRGTHDPYANSIRMVFVAGGCPPEGHGRQSTWQNVYKAADEMQQPVEQLLSHIMQEQEVAFILSDILFRWSSSTAHKFSLPWVVFWPASAATFSTFLYFSDLAADGKGVPISENGAAGSTMIDEIPGLPPTRLCDLHKVWNTSTGKLEHLLLRSFNPAALKEASYLILNTFEELEGQVLQALRKRLPTVAVGPLLPSHYMQQLHKYDSAARRPDPTLEPPLSLFPEDRTCLAWLDTQAPSSVLFISFGSISLRTERQLQELALGVEASGCPFLWVRRPAFDTCADKTNPGNCCEADGHPRPDGRGLIVAWAPQLQVLSHPSVGGFITHCGWNSVMESVATGVPMLCWADTGERMSNQRFVVEFWKCGIHMVTSSKRAAQHIDEAVLVGQEEVENSVRQLMYEEAGTLVRARAAELRAISKGAFVDAASRCKGLVEAMELKRPTHGCT